MKTIKFTHSYNKLGNVFYSENKPVSVTKPCLFVFNLELQKELGLDDTVLSFEKGISYFSGNQIIENSSPLAMAYSGHQFGHFSPQLGDGRAILLGSFLDNFNTEYDLQLKGSGRTNFSRGGDGRSALGPVLREYLVSEAMARLGVPTTRALSAVTTGEQVLREGYKPGGVITRISRSFVRVGTFQFFSSRNDLDSVKKLAEYVIKRNYSEIKDNKDKYKNLLKQVINRQAYLISKWMGLGFIHGVMNTDNMSICGETIDYGPCAFMDDFSFNKKFSFIDEQGRYAYSNQPQMALWNLTRFAESILSLLADEQKDTVQIAEELLNDFPQIYENYWLDEISKKIGMKDVKEDGAKRKKLADDLLNLMAESKADFTNAFYHLSQLKKAPSKDDNAFIKLFFQKNKIEVWLERWRTMLGFYNISDDKRLMEMKSVNPVIIPRNHQIEKVIRAAEDNNDFEAFKKLNEVLKSPFIYNKEKNEYMKAPVEEEIVERTFCGT